MLVFVDESGDLGFKFERGSTKYFTIALVVFENGDAAMACHRVIESLKVRLNLPERYEFHFHDDDHHRRLTFLSTVARQDFSCYTFTLDKASPRLTVPGLKYRSPGYKWVCRIALQNMGSELRNATVVIDGSGEREFKKQMSAYLRKELNTELREQIREVKISRSHSDPLLQLADYVAGVTNRVYQSGYGVEVYESYLRPKRRSQRKWP